MSEPTQRLDSWKAIAAHLGRDVRTAQRWEFEGLPVRRLRHDKLASVFAYSREIDDWVASRSSRVLKTPVTEIAPTPERAPGRNRPLMAVGLAVAVVAVTVAATVPRARRAAPTAASREQTLSTVSDLLIAGRFEAAENILKPVIDQTTDPLAETYLAWTLLSEGKPEAEYLVWIDRAAKDISFATSRAEHYFVRGSHAQLHDDSRSAITWYESAIAVDPRSYWSLNNVAYLYARRGWDSLALDRTRTAADLRPDSGDKAASLAAVLFLYGDFADAMNYRTVALSKPDLAHMNAAGCA